VPTSNRDVNSRSAIFNFEGLSDINATIDEFAARANTSSGDAPPALGTANPPRTRIRCTNRSCSITFLS